MKTMAYRRRVYGATVSIQFETHELTKLINSPHHVVAEVPEPIFVDGVQTGILKRQVRVEDFFDYGETDCRPKRDTEIFEFEDDEMIAYQAAPGYHLNEELAMYLIGPLQEVF